MKMKMKMKNNKMFLALVVVAALAMVSVAGVALTSDNQSDAAEIPMVSGITTIDLKSTDGTFDLYAGTITTPAIVIFNVAQDVMYTGSISFGIYDSTSDTFTAINTVTLSGVSAVTVKVTCDNAGVSSIVVSENLGTATAYTGDISVTAGTVTFGSASAAFSGKITSKDLTVTAVNVGGYAITYGSTAATLSGAISKVIPTGATSTTKYTLTVEGTGYIGSFTVNSGELIIADGATLSNEAVVQTFTSDVVLTSYASDVDYAVAVDSTGVSTYADVVNKVMTFADLKMSERYTLIIAAGSGVESFVGTMSFTAGTTSGVYTVVLSSSVTAAGITAATAGTVISDIADSESATALVSTDISETTTPAVGKVGYTLSGATTFSINADEFICAYNITDSTVGAYNSSTGAITFTQMTGTTTHEVLIVFSSAGVYYYAILTATDNGTNFTDVVISATTTVSEANVEETPAATGDIGFSSTAGTILKYYSSTDTCIFAKNLDDSSANASVSSGSITFSKAFDDGDVAFVLVKNGTTVSYYIGEVSVSNAMITYDGITANVLSYATGYTVVYAGNATQEETAIVNATAKTITFTGIANTNDLWVVLKDTNGKLYVYYGEATATNDVVSNLALSSYTTNLPVYNASTATNGIKATTPITADPDPEADILITNVLGGKITVNGTLSVTYINATVYGTIINNGVITVTGTLVYQNNAPLTYTSTTVGITASSYMVAGTTTTPNTYTYTTLANAMENSATVTIYGVLTISKDVILTGNSTATPIANNVIIADNSEMIIGTSKATAVVTVPVTTTLSIGTNAKITVSYGKLVFESKTSYVDDLSVFSAVSTKEGTSFVYTDLATALSTAVADDVITLRGNASIATTSEIPADVEVKLAGKILTVKAGAIFTVSGSITMATSGGYIVVDTAEPKTSTTDAKDAGTIILNSYKVAYTTLTLNGILTFSSLFDNTATTATSFGSIVIGTDATSTAPAQVNVLGNVLITGSMSAATADKYVTVTISGTLTNSTTAIFGANVYSTVKVTGTYTSKVAGVYVDTMIVTGTGVVSYNAIANVIYVDDLTIGTAATNTKENVNGATVSVEISSGGFATIYGTYDEEAVTITGVTTGMVTVFYIDTDVIYKTVLGNTAGVPSTYLKSPVLTGLLFNGWYDAPVSGTRITTATAGLSVGSPSEIYGYTTVSTTSMTFSAVQNGTWYVNGNIVSGTTYVAYSETYNIQFLADNGYELKDVSILVNNKAMPLNYTPTNGDVLTISGSVEEKSVGDSGLSVTEILLIVMVIIIALIAVVVILKLMRS